MGGLGGGACGVYNGGGGGDDTPCNQRRANRWKKGYTCVLVVQHGNSYSKWQDSPCQSFKSTDFSQALQMELNAKYEEYSKARKKVGGAFWGWITNFTDKERFVNTHVVPAVNACEANRSMENMRALAAVLRDGSDKFTKAGTSSGHFSNIARLFEEFYFRLTCVDLNAAVFTKIEPFSRPSEESVELREVNKASAGQ